MEQTTIVFKSQEAATNKDNFVFELDHKSNNNQTTFQPGIPCYIKIFPANQSPTIRTTMGNASIVRKNVPMEIEEFLVFAKSNEATLQKELGTLIDWEWIGRVGGTPTFIGDKVILSHKGSGILRVHYKTFYDQIKLISAHGGQILVEAENSKRYGYIVVNYEPKLKPVYLTVKDACSRTVIAEAQVYLDEQFVGLTDNTGRIYLGDLVVGRTYNLKITKEGYQSSDKDTIANDSFTVAE